MFIVIITDISDFPSQEPMYQTQTSTPPPPPHSTHRPFTPPPPTPSKVVTRPGYGLLEVTTDRRHTADGSNLEIWGVAAYMCALFKIRLAIQQAVVSVLCFTQYYQQLDPIYRLNFPGKAYLQHCDFSTCVGVWAGVSSFSSSSSSSSSSFI